MATVIQFFHQQGNMEAVGIGSFGPVPYPVLPVSPRLYGGTGVGSGVAGALGSAG
jgi:hypothetical protein